MKATRIACLFFTCITFLDSYAEGATLYEQDFESLVDGNLSGQDGWVGAVIPVGPAEALNSSRVAGPLTALVGFQQNRTDRPLPSIANYRRIEFAFDAYAAETGRPSHNHFVGFGNFGVGWAVNNPTETSVARWLFLQPSGAAAESIVGGFDTPVSMSIVLDRGTGEVYGRYDFGSSSGETSRYSLSAAQVAALDTLTINFEGRVASNTRSLLEVDNLLVSGNVPVPEPTSLLLASCVGSAILMSRSMTRAYCVG